MTYEEFEAKFRGRFLVFQSEAWFMRKESPSALGMALDRQNSEVRSLMRDVYNAFNPPCSVPVLPPKRAQ